jgi:hypothetical protein
MLTMIIFCAFSNVVSSYVSVVHHEILKKKNVRVYVLRIKILCMKKRKIRESIPEKSKKIVELLTLTTERSINVLTRNL